MLIADYDRARDLGYLIAVHGVERSVAVRDVIAYEVAQVLGEVYETVAAVDIAVPAVVPHAEESVLLGQHAERGAGRDGPQGLGG